MRFHVLGLPHTHTTEEFSACAFTEKVRKFCVMMKNRGHEVFLYAGHKNEAPCDEHIICMSETERQAFVGSKHYIFASFDPSHPTWVNFNIRAIQAIEHRIQPQDFIISFAGLSHKQVHDAFPDHLYVEAGIGYGGNFAKFRVWESYAWMHTCYGAQGGGDPNSIDGHWFDAVIPGYFEMEKFPFSPNKDPYLFFIGRLTHRKGYQIAIEVAQELGRKLVIAGQPDPEAMPPSGPNIEYVGVIGPEARGKLMSRATAVFVPTIYIEPFGNVAVEAQACGTPVLSTDWGAMTETVIHGETGFRCRTFGQFLRAVDDCRKLDPWHIRERAVEKYSLEPISRLYEEYFERLLHLFGSGWYEGRRAA